MRFIRFAVAAPLAALALAAWPVVATAGDVGVSVHIGPLELRGVHGLPIAVGRVDLGPLPLPPLILPLPLRIHQASRAQPPVEPIYDERDGWYPPPGYRGPPQPRRRWEGPRADWQDERHGDGHPGRWHPDRRRDEWRDHRHGRWDNDRGPDRRGDRRWDGRHGD